jgi:uncharacterized membrane protein
LTKPQNKTHSQELLLYYTQAMNKKRRTSSVWKDLATKTSNYMQRYNYLGLVGALVFFCFSLLPSLMPRTWLLQGLVSGISIAIGYGLGVLSSAFIRWMTEAEISDKYKVYGWKILWFFAPFLVVLFIALGSVWQSEVRTLLGVADTEPTHGLWVLLASLLIGAGLIGLVARIRRLGGWFIRKFDVHLPFRISVALGLGVTFFLIIWVSSGVFFNFFVTQSNRIFRYRNTETPPGIMQPQSVYKSGSPDALSTWESIGRQGRVFVASGPDREEIEAFSESPAQEPVRIYVGVDAAETARERAKIAVEEMRRTNALEREYLIVATPTGTGWIEPQTVNALEYMHRGDTAIVAQQYSYLPSWISFLVDQEVAREAGRELFEAVYAEWDQLPENERPKLIIYGLSLGSFGGQAAFSGANDMLRTVDGALFQGTPNDTTLWREITDQRDEGSPEWQPVFRNGEAIRFASAPEDIDPTTETWQKPRILYMQHASDPIVWFSFDLILNKPAWLSEVRGPDVSPTVRWYPFVTFFQLAVDQMIGNSVPEGRGHLYGNTVIESWDAVTQAAEWSEEEADRLRPILLQNE